MALGNNNKQAYNGTDQMSVPQGQPKLWWSASQLSMSYFATWGNWPTQRMTHKNLMTCHENTWQHSKKPVVFTKGMLQQKDMLQKIFDIN